jgi:hypothetical protein
MLPPKATGGSGINGSCEIGLEAVMLGLLQCITGAPHVASGLNLGLAFKLGGAVFHVGGAALSLACDWVKSLARRDRPWVTSQVDAARDLRRPVVRRAARRGRGVVRHTNGLS